MFHNVRFPEAISYGSKGGPKFMTSIVTLASGKERRNIDWVQTRAEYDVAHGIKDANQMEELRAFFYNRYGRAHSFRFKDWGDFDLINEPLGVGDGVNKAFQVRKTYVDGPFSYVRKITKPVAGSFQGMIVGTVPKFEGTHYTVDYTTGIVTFTAAPAVGLTVALTTGEFDVHCRFDTDQFDPEHEFWQTESWSTIMIVEVKD
jgi:uncharacterized protein (TIGR02217 family)